MASRIGLVPLFRRLATWSPLHLGIGYTACVTVALIWNRLASGSGLTVLQPLAAVIALLGISLLFTVVTWYQDEDLVAAAVLLAVITGAGTMLGSGLASLVFTGSVAELAFGLAGSFFNLLLRVIVLGPVFALLVWGGRRLRRFFAPATVNDERSQS